MKSPAILCGAYFFCCFEATIGFEPMVRVLQTLALSTWPRRHDPYSGVLKKERATRLELVTFSLARRCSTN